MSSTQNSQNLLVNVLRPVYTYSSETGFTAGVVATNLKAVNTDAITAGVAQLGDTGGNIYLGSNAGSTTIGTNSNNVAFGVGAASGINGVQNSVFIGASAGQGISNASNDVVIGAGTSVVGSRNIVIGNNDLVTGSNNFVIASDTILTGSYKVNIGNLIQGDISAKTLSFTTGTDISGGGYFGGNVGIRYPNPTHSLDVSGSIYATSNIILSDGSQNRPSLTFASDASAGMFRDALGNVGFARAGRYSMKLDPSGSILYTNLTVEGTLACATFDAGGIAATNLAVPGYIRNNDLTFNMDMSQGNLAFTGTGQSRVGNVFISNARLTASNGITGTNFDLSSGNLILSNNVVAGGLFSNTATNTSNYLGGVYLVDNEVRPSRLLEKGTGAFDLCSNGLSLIGKITGGDDTQSNRIGGIILSNSNAIVPGFIRNALTPTTLNISGGNISNSGNTTSSNFTTITASSNNIGGVVLNATNVSNVGTLGTTNALVSGYLRDALTPSGLDISGGNISNSGITRTTTLVPNNLYPVSTSDISAIAYIRMGGGDVSNLPFLWFRQGGDPARYSGINFGSFNTNSMYFYNANGTLRVKSIDTLATSQSQLDACASLLSINQSGKVGIGVETPRALLDIGKIGTNGGLQIYGLSNNNITRPVIDSCGTNIPTNTPAYEIRSATVNGADGFLRIRAGGIGGAGGPWPNYTSYIDLTGFSTLPDMCNNIVLGTAGTERMRIDSSGRIGIGTSAPSYRLEVSNSETTNNDVRITGGAGNVANSGGALAFSAGQGGASGFMSRIKGVLCNAIVGTEEQGGIIFETRASNASSGQALTERVRIGANGRVGIGTSAPSTMLDISASSGGIKVGSSGTGSLTIGTAGVASEYANLTMNGYFTLNKVATTNEPMVTFPSDPNVATGGFIFMSNKVGIGTTTPAYSLDISAGNTANTLRVQATSYPSVLLSTPTSAGSGQVLFDGVGSKYILRASAVPLVFENPGNIERMRIGTDGKVGIGNPNPQKLLDISSATTSEGINITAPNASIVLRPQGSANTMELYSATGGQGLYTSSNFLQLSTNSQTGNSGLIVNGNKVGIGTSTPASLLTVAGDISYSGALINAPINNSNFIGGVVLSNGYMRAGVGTFTAPGISFISDPSSGLYSASSNMGIATAGLDRISISSNGTINVGGRFYFYPDFNNLPAPSLCNGIYFVSGYNSPNSGRIIYGDGSGWRMHFSIKSSATVIDRVTITDGGTIGIGTTSPGAFLDLSVGSSLPLNLNRTVGGQNSYTLWSNNGSTRWGFGVLNADTGSGNGGCDLNILAYNDGGGLLCNTMVIKRSNGNIGMGGNTAPAFTLDVNGTIRGSSNVVAVSTITSNVSTTLIGFTDVSLTLPYTPKQSTAANVKLLVQVAADIVMGSGSGPDAVQIALHNQNGTEVGVTQQHWLSDYLGSRGSTYFGGGQFAVMTVSGGVTSRIYSRLRLSSGDDTPSYRNWYLAISELSTT